MFILYQSNQILTHSICVFVCSQHCILIVLTKKKNPNRNSLEIIYRTNEFVGLLDSSPLRSH